MEVLKENNLELVVSSSTPSFQDLLDSQQDLFRSQIDQLQNIVVRQCEVTGVNPLSQEMAAGALSIKIGKRPRDLLNPKAVKYMQSVFSIKDAISKKESREISALFGVTVTQVRDFFNGQRSRVRKSVRLSREKALRANACKEEVQDGVSTSSDPMIPINTVPLNSVGPTNVEGPSCSTQDEILPGIDDSDKNFIENIFAMMRNEETFSGQVKLMEWILQVQNSSVLNWFLTKGSVMILATWLSQAATEEQTSVLHVILKVLCHLPLHKAVPVHMSAILQSVNRLRFYRTSDISNRARILLSRWSKVFARSQAMKKPNAKKSLSDVQNERLLQQSIGEIMDNEIWESKIDISEDNLAPSYEGSENIRKLESSQPLKLLTASTDDSSKKLIRGVSSSQTRERRKVLLVEQPGQKPGVRSSQVTRSVPANQGRPLSADDIQKAKMRAQFMQSKYGKTSTSSNEGHQVKIEGPNRLPSQACTFFPASRADARSKIEEHKKSVMVPSKVSNQQESPLDKMILDPDEPLWKKCKRVQIPWLTPPEMRIDGDWRLGSGESSKEVEVQKNRICREKEIVYNTVQEIPANPKEPWDREMDYDDTLTPEIPTEQLPDADGAEPMASSSENKNISVTPATTTTATSSQNGNGGMPEPDLELLAVLLKNPELVFALTSGQGGGNLSSEDTVKLLDMIKVNGVGGLGNVNGLGTMAEEKVEVSLPSPTPSSDPVTSGWRSEVAKNPFSRQSSVTNREAYVIPGIAGTEEEKRTATSSMRPEIRSADIMVPYQPENFPTLSQQTIPPFRFPQTPTSLPERQIHTSSPNIPLPNFQAANSPMRRAETLGHVKPAPVSIVLNTPERQPIEFSIPPLLPTRPQTQPHQPHQMPMPEPLPSAHSWSVRQGFISNPHSQANHDNYNALVPGPPGHRGRDEYMGEPGYETWSPENSPTRSPEYVSGWNRMNSGHNYRPDQSRPRNSSRYRDHNRYGDRRWRERDRDRRR
ncbi:homeobox protein LUMINIDEPENDENS [Cornus florida]|uniref:homeobox protein LUMINIDEPENDENS n=1 Tax=Cornus florida TaxID=4283 RepID=UPI0028A21C40|nr:homeobox protein LUMINIDEPENDENS [Cornus florida]